MVTLFTTGLKKLYLKVTLTLEQTMKARWGSMFIALLILVNPGTRWGWVDKATIRPLYPRGKRSGTRCAGGWVYPRADLDWCGKSCLHRDSIPGPSSPFRNYAVFPQDVFVCCVWISEHAAIFSLCNNDWLLFFITETECVNYSVRTGSLRYSVKCC